MKNIVKVFLFACLLANFSTNKAAACACGCGVFNVATSAIIPNCEGGTAFLQYDQMKQTRNWGENKKSDEHNHDKEITTKTITLGGQYMFNREWGAALRVPFVERYVKSRDHENEHGHGHGHEEGESYSYARHNNIGDVRVNAIYSGLFDDMSTGIIFGLKLPTGQTNAKTLERNQQIGTGSVDSILGFYHVGTFGNSTKFGYFTQASWERPFIVHQNYNPGYEVSASVGAYYNLGQVGLANKVAPILQFSGTKKGQNKGLATADHNQNSGYDMVFFAPGIEIAFKQFKFYADVEFPVYRNVNGTQLVPQNLYKAIVAYNF